MLVQFKVGNYLSFKDVVTLSVAASPRKELEDSNVFFVNENSRLLKSAVIYGANASGKSNLIKAMRFFRLFVLTSSKDTQVTEEIDVTNFKLSVETENQPSSFEIVFFFEGVRYRYGFELDKAKVHNEWLFYSPKGKEAKLFVRDQDSVEIGTFFKEGKDLFEKTRINALFLSVVAQFNGEISTKILNWFRKFRVISGLRDRPYLSFTMDRLKEPDYKQKILNFLKIADLGIEDVELEESITDEKEIPEELRTKLGPIATLKNIKVSTAHKKYDNANILQSMIKFDLNIEESDGTRKFFAMSAPILDSLKNGYVLVIDELDSRLHPKLTQFLIDLFNSKQHNPLNAQLIFASHDVNLLKKKIFRRDQIWFTEKNKYGSSDLYSLLEFRVRKDASFDKDYILGKYGAIPFIGDFYSLFEPEETSEK